MKGRKVIFASIWPLLPNSLDCGQNIYRGTIKVIHLHRKSRPFENSVNIKHGLLSFYPSSFFSRTEQRQAQTISSTSSLDLRIFCRFYWSPSSSNQFLFSMIQNSIWQWSDSKHHIQQMSNNRRAWRVYQAHSGEQWCLLNNTRQKWVAWFHTTLSAVKYYSGSRMDYPHWKTNRSLTSALSQTHIAPSQVLPCQQTHTPRWGCVIVNTGVLCWTEAVEVL